MALFDRGGLLAALTARAALSFNRLSRRSGLGLVRAAQVEIAGDHIPAQTDGNAAGEASLSICDAPKAVNVVMPP